MTQRVARKEADRLYSRLNAGEESEVPGLLEQWLREGKMSEEEALNESVGMFLAGVDTVIIILIVLMVHFNIIYQTANQSVFLLHAVAKYPEVQEKLYAEVKSVLGDSKQATAQQLSSMPYLKGCMLESFRYDHTSTKLDYVATTLRLQSTTFGFSRVLEEDSVLLGYQIPANVITIIAARAVSELTPRS